MIERHQIVAGKDFDFNCRYACLCPAGTGQRQTAGGRNQSGRSLTMQGLLKISQEKLLALNLEEMQKPFSDYYQNPDVIKARKKMGLGENITDVELECLAQTWSEHCKHKIFNSRINYTDGQKQTHH